MSENESNLKHYNIKYKKINMIKWSKLKNVLFKYIENKKYQRCIAVIDRRQHDIDSIGDVLYIYEAPSDDEYNCNSLPRDNKNFINLSLFYNTINFILPPNRFNPDVELYGMENEPFGMLDEFFFDSCSLLLSFHCFSSTEIRCYSNIRSYHTRFSIQDIKYYLPEYFVDREWSKIHDKFNNDKIFAQKYEECKKKCIDVVFEEFYKQFICKPYKIY